MVRERREAAMLATAIAASRRRSRLRMSVEGIANGGPCYCSMAYIKRLTLCRIVPYCQVSESFRL